MFHHRAFKNGGFSGAELVNALHAHARMGYNFHVPEVSAHPAPSDTVDVSVTVVQVGVAPFYYPLDLAISCPEMATKTISGVDQLIDQGASNIFTFTELPAMPSCLNSLSLSLESPYIYPERPMKFAQGNGFLSFSLPLPDTPCWPRITSPSSGASLVMPVSAGCCRRYIWTRDSTEH